MIMGALLAFAVSIKYQTFIIIPVAIEEVAWIFSETMIKKRHKFAEIYGNIIAFVFTTISVFVFINIFPLLHFVSWYTWLRGVATTYGAGQWGIKFYPYWFLFTIGLGKTVSFFVFYGILLTFASRAKKRIVVLLLSFPAAVFFFFTFYSYGIYVRSFTFVIPILLLFAGYAVVAVTSFLINKKYFFFNGILLILVTLISWNSLTYSLTLTRYLSKENNQDCVAQWLEEHLPVRARVGILPPVPMDVLNKKKIDWVYFNERTNFTVPELADDGVQYLVIDTTPYSGYFIGWTWQGARYWSMPIDIFNNMLPGLLMRELSAYTVLRCSKPWPTPDRNYLVVKLPPKGLL